MWHLTEPTTPPDENPPADNIETITIPEIAQPTYAKDQPIGDNLLLPKPHDITRIIIQNPNGFSVGQAAHFQPYWRVPTAQKPT